MTDWTAAKEKLQMETNDFDAKIPVGLKQRRSKTVEFTVKQVPGKTSPKQRANGKPAWANARPRTRARMALSQRARGDRCTWLKRPVAGKKSLAGSSA